VKGSLVVVVFFQPFTTTFQL